jgi:hypothetical protein
MRRENTMEQEKKMTREDDDETGEEKRRKRGVWTWTPPETASSKKTFPSSSKMRPQWSQLLLVAADTTCALRLFRLNSTTSPNLHAVRTAGRTRDEKQRGMNEKENTKIERMIE